jgi:mlo protein
LFCPAEFMLLGFISLLLRGGTRSIAKICIPFELGDTMLPCKIHDYKKHTEVSYAESILWRRVLAGPAGGDDHCAQYVSTILKP